MVWYGMVVDLPQICRRFVVQVAELLSIYGKYLAT